MTKELFTTVFILAYVFISGSSSAQAGLCLTYEADIKKSSVSNVINVNISVENIEDSTSSLVMELPVLPSESPEFETFDYSEYVHNIQAYTDNHEEIDIKKETDEYGGRFIIENPSTKIYIEYDVENKVGHRSPLTNQETPVVYFNDDLGWIWSQFVFLVPDYRYGSSGDHSFIHVNFDLPEDWEVMSPFKKENGFYNIEKDDVISYSRHFKESAFYFGNPKYKTELYNDGTVHKIAKMVGDENKWELKSQEDLDRFMEKIVKSYKYFVTLFDHNPFLVDLWMPNIKIFENEKQISPGVGYMGNGWHYWPEGREFEITCHLIQSWMFGSPRGPLMASTGITKGIGEYYLGLISSYELFKNNVDLGKMYYTYLVYDRMHGTNVHDHYEYDFMKGYAIGILLDDKLKEISNNKYSLKDVLSNIYKKYHLTNHTVTYNDMQDEIDKMTKDDLDKIFSKYVYGDQKIPFYQYISDYKQEFENIPYMLNQTFHMNLYGKVFPLFLLVEITLQNNDHIMAGMYIDVYLNDIAETAINKYGIDSLTKENLVTILSDLTDKDCSGFFSRWEDTYGILDLNDFKEWLLAYQNDTDNDGLVDSWEKQYFGDIHHISGGKDDYDEDELSNVGEQQYGTDPTNKDTDGDGFTDGEEVQAATDPTKKTDYPQMSIDIDINYSDNPTTIARDESPILTINLTPGNKKDQNSDWWIAAYSPLGWKSLIIEQNRLVWTEGIKRCLEAKLTHLESIEIPAPSLKVGENHIYFAVDDNADGRPDATWWDAVEVNVE